MAASNCSPETNVVAEDSVAGSSFNVGAENGPPTTRPSVAPTPLELMLWKLLAAYRRSLLTWLVVTATLALALFVYSHGARAWRTIRAEAALRAVHADYAMDSRTVWSAASSSLPTAPEATSVGVERAMPSACKERSRWSREDWTNRLRALVSCSIYRVQICEGNLDDRQLGFVENLREVRYLELRSDLATDKTLTMISRLPKLRRLTILGKQFSAMGLLKLRALRDLIQIRFDPQQYTPIERAVLKAEFAGIAVTEMNSEPPHLSVSVCAK